MYRIIISLVLCAVQLNYAAGSCKDCLILTTHIKNGNASHARTLAKVNSSAYLGYESYSGFMTVKEEYNSNLFFWFFPAETPLAETPWIIWLQGGPGFSSMLGLFGLIGPLSVENGQVEERNLSWASDYSLVFLDNPVGAGFSFTDDESGYPDNEDDVGAQMLEFVNQFLQMFPELQQAPLFIVGQSYAGKYVPALGIQIHRYNTGHNDKRINLKGIAVGNGLIELSTVMHYSDLCRSLGFLDGDQLARLKVLENDVVQLIDGKRLVDAANKFNETIEYLKKHSGINIYNFLKDPSSKAPEFEHYLNRTEVREQIHVGNATFDYNNQHVYQKMLPDFANTTKLFVEELLEHYGVMFYSGQLDVILPYSAAKHMYATMNWSRRAEYVQAPRRRLRRHANGSVVGFGEHIKLSVPANMNIYGSRYYVQSEIYKKMGGNFVDILLRGAGHSVPSDQPDLAKFIIDVFIDDHK